jgi:hypothetical protein
MRRSLRLVLCPLLCASVGLGSPVAAASDGESSAKDLERRSKLDLSALWQDYSKSGDQRPFAAYVEARYVRQRDIGRGLVFGGFGVLLIGIIQFSLVAPRNDRTGAKYASYGVMGAGAVVMIVGGAMWRKNFRRLEAIEQAGLALGSRGRVRLLSAGPVALPRGGGFGVGLAF